MEVKTRHINFKRYGLTKNHFLGFCYYGLSGILIWAGLNKIIYPVAIFDTLEAFMIPEAAYVSIAVFIPLLEIGTGVALIFRWKPMVTIGCLFLMFFLFWGISVYGFWFGLEVDCGCFGKAMESSFGWSMTVRNTLFLFASGWLWMNRKNLFAQSK